MGALTVTARGAIGLSLLASWVEPVAAVYRHGVPYPRGLVAWLGTWSATPIPLLAASAVYLLGVVLLLGNHRPRVGALLAFLMLAWASHLQRCGWEIGGITHGKLMGAGVLAAWVIGGRQRGWEYGAAVIAACYTSAALSKLAAHGLAWGDGGSLALLIAERGMMVGAPLAEIREAASGRPWLCATLGRGALVIEAAGLAFLMPRWRLGYAAAVAAMHLGIGLLMGYWYLEWVALVGGIAVLTRRGG